MEFVDRDRTGEYETNYIDRILRNPESMAKDFEDYKSKLGKNFTFSEYLTILKMEIAALFVKAIFDYPENMMDQIGKYNAYLGNPIHEIVDALKDMRKI